MENLFLHYMHERVRREEEQTVQDPGPVITISREYGCYGNEVAELLTKKINAIKAVEEKSKWILVSHQILYDAAKSLKTKPDEISHIFGAKEKSIFGDLVSIFTKDKYLSDIQIKRTLAEIVRSYSVQGNTVIVGRAGCVIAKHIKKSVHVKIIAPFCWRVEMIKKRFDLSTSDAIDKVKETDKNREAFMEFFRGNKPDSELFDIILNRSTIDTEGIVDMILKLAKTRDLI